MEVRLNGKVRAINSVATGSGVAVDSATATGSLDIYPGDTDASNYVLTNNLSGNLAVGINTRNARAGQVCRVTRNGAAPGAVTLTVKSGTAAAGTTLGRAIAASRNGFVEARFDGTNWVCIGMSEHT